MKIPLLFFVLVVDSGCSFNGSSNLPRNLSKDEVFTLIPEWQSFVTAVKTGLNKLARFFVGKRNLPAYCSVILAEHPTPEDFERNWTIDALQEFCADNDRDCQRKNQTAFKKGLECYQD